MSDRQLPVFNPDEIPTNPFKLHIFKCNKKVIPAHYYLWTMLPEALMEHTYLHYIHSGVSCIRSLKGHLGQLQRLLFEELNKTPGVYKRCHAEALLCSTVAKVASPYNTPQGTVNVNFDTSRNNGNIPGYYVYLGTNDANSFLKTLKKKEEPAEDTSNNG